MKHYLNICDVDGRKISPVDVITFGSPCQDLSVAGKRAGLKHEENGDEETTRSGLFMEAVRIIKEMRESTNGKYPKFAVWENVPGAFSSNKGQDFRIVLEEMCRIKDETAVVPMPKKWNGGALSWETVTQLHGESWMLNTTESPSVVAESSLSQILQESVPEKYYLSQKACRGILRRASVRGKELPKVLKKALELQANI